VIALDEINRLGDAKGQGMLMSAMDGQRKLYLEQEEPGRQIVEMAPGVIIGTTANIGVAYSGTEALDPALLDRMLKMKLGYSEREPDVLRAHGLGTSDTRRVMKIATEIRKQHASGSLTDSISTRGLVRVARMLVHGFEIYDAFEASLGIWDEESEVVLKTICEVKR
jgi:MoxR-like ATPase